MADAADPEANIIFGATIDPELSRARCGSRSWPPNFSGVRAGPPPGSAAAEAAPARAERPPLSRRAERVTRFDLPYPAASREPGRGGGGEASGGERPPASSTSRWTRRPSSTAESTAVFRRPAHARRGRRTRRSDPRPRRARRGGRRGPPPDRAGRRRGARARRRTPSTPSARRPSPPRSPRARSPGPAPAASCWSARPRRHRPCSTSSSPSPGSGPPGGALDPARPRLLHRALRRRGPGLPHRARRRSPCRAWWPAWARPTAAPGGCRSPSWSRRPCGSRARGWCWAPRRPTSTRSSPTCSRPPRRPRRSTRPGGGCWAPGERAALPGPGRDPRPTSARRARASVRDGPLAERDRLATWRRPAAWSPPRTWPPTGSSSARRWRCEYRGVTLLTNPPPSSGGALIAAALRERSAGAPAAATTSRTTGRVARAGVAANALRDERLRRGSSRRRTPSS